MLQWKGGVNVTEGFFLLFLIKRNNIKSWANVLVGYQLHWEFTKNDKETLGKWKNGESSVKVIGPLKRPNALILLVLEIVYIRENEII